MAVKFNVVEFRELEAREQRDRVLAVIAEFGGEKKERMLVPEDDPANNEIMVRLAGEIPFLRDQIQRLAKGHGVRAGGQTVRADPTGTALAAGRQMRQGDAWLLGLWDWPEHGWD